MMTHVEWEEEEKYCNWVGEVLSFYDFSVEMLQTHSAPHEVSGKFWLVIKNDLHKSMVYVGSLSWKQVSASLNKTWIPQVLTLINTPLIIYLATVVPIHFSMFVYG